MWVSKKLRNFDIDFKYCYLLMVTLWKHFCLMDKDIVQKRLCSKEQNGNKAKDGSVVLFHLNRHSDKGVLLGMFGADVERLFGAGALDDWHLMQEGLIMEFHIVLEHYMSKVIVLRTCGSVCMVVIFQPACENPELSHNIFHSGCSSGVAVIALRQRLSLCCAVQYCRSIFRKQGICCLG